MKLYRISQTENSDYDTYDSAVIAAASAEEAQNTDPANGQPMSTLQYDGKPLWEYSYNSWASSPDNVFVEYLGEAADQIEAGVICASFNAG